MDSQSSKLRDYEVSPQERGRDLVIAGVAVIHSVFLLFAGGLKFILLSAVPYALATALYVWADRDQGKPVFITSDWIIFVVVVIGAAIGIYGLATGGIMIWRSWADKGSDISLRRCRTRSTGATRLAGCPAESH
ncbi:hypothetical protein [Paraburkholderia sp. BR10954]|uniref:hypothetical protein n=1 Tax=Paraburkholderia sp. BR10954 TaxID=3236995 RepID=UPI0034D2DC66